MLPFASKPPPRFCRAGMDPRVGDPPHGGVASDRVYICTQLPVVPVSFCLAFPSVPCAERVGSLFLLHFPGGCPRRTLSVILPCDARTFLMPIPCGAMTRGSPACEGHYSMTFRKSQGGKARRGVRGDRAVLGDTWRAHRWQAREERVFAVYPACTALLAPFIQLAR